MIKWIAKIFCSYTYGETKIMGKLEDIVARQNATLEAVQAVDAIVEDLFDQIKALTGDGITAEAAAVLLAKEDEIDAAVAKIASDDEPDSE